MSTFYGMIRGNRMEATRGGSRASGFKSTCQSYDGSIIVSMHYNYDNELRVLVGTNEGSSCSTDSKSFDFNGTFEEFKELLKLRDDIKNGKVSVVRHRKK